jgi:hypothetical protein
MALATLAGSAFESNVYAGDDANSRTAGAMIANERIE